METCKNGRLWEVIMNFNAIRNDYEWRWSLIKIKFRKVDGGWVRRRATLNLAKSPCKVWNSYFLTYFKLDPRGDYFWIGLSHNSPHPHISLVIREKFRKVSAVPSYLIIAVLSGFRIQSPLRSFVAWLLYPANISCRLGSPKPILLKKICTKV